MTYNAASRKDIRRAEKSAALAETTRIEFLVVGMSTIPGRAWFHDLLARCHLFSDPFTGDALLEAYSKGERNIGLSLFADIVANSPDHYITMMREAQHRNLADEQRRHNDGSRPDPDSDAERALSEGAGWDADQPDARGDAE